MAKKEKLVTGIDVGSHAIKVCQLMRVGDTYELLALGSAVIPPGCVEDGVVQEKEAVSEVLANLFTNLKLKGAKVGISISGYSVIVKKIQLDSMEPDALAEYIANEAEQYIPFDREDVYLDFQDLKTGSEEFERTDVMLVAAKKEVIDDYVEMLEGQGLRPVLVDVDGFALENIWETRSGGSENVALVDIGASKMNINIIADGASVLARDIAVGSQQLTDQIVNKFDIEYDEAERLKLGLEPLEGKQEQLEEIFTTTCTQWVLEVKKAIDMYSANHPENPLERLVLSGGGAKVSGLHQFIKQETGLEVVLFNPFESMTINKKKIDPDYVRAIASEMAIAAGLAIRPAEF